MEPDRREKTTWKLPPTPRLETERLVLQPLALADAPQIQPLFSIWENVRLLAATVPWPYPADGAYCFHRDVTLPAMERREQWVWTLRLKTSPEQIVGSLTLALAEDNRGFWLARSRQGQGLMREAVEAANDFWFGVLGMPRLRSTKASENLASRRISEQTGGRVVGTGVRDFVGGRLPYETWELTAEEWRAGKKLREGSDLRGGEVTSTLGAGVAIRRACEGDLRELLVLERGSVTAPHWAEGEYRAMLGEGDSGGVRRCLLVTEVNGLVAGFAVGKAVTVGLEVEAEIESVVVREGERRRGLGSALCRAVMRWAAGEGAGAIELEVRAGSVGTIELYGGLGFVEVGRRPGYYERPDDDAVVMRCGLAREPGGERIERFR